MGFRGEPDDVGNRVSSHALRAFSNFLRPYDIALFGDSEQKKSLGTMSEGDAQIQGKLGSVSEAEVEDAGASAEFKAQVLSEKPSWAGCSSGSAQLRNSWHGTVLNAESTDTLKKSLQEQQPGDAESLPRGSQQH